MSEYLFELFVLTVRLYAVMDPMGAIPIFISLTSKKSTEERMKMLKLATGVVVTIVSILSISGSTILEVLGITPPSIKIGGGILLMVLAIDEMRGILRSRMPLEEELAVVPLAIPLLVGPGTIAMILMLTSIMPWYIVLVAALIASLLSFLTLLSSELLLRVLGKSATAALSKFMTIILAAFASEMIFSALVDWGVI